MGARRFVTLSVFLVTVSALARPEYAARSNAVSCTGCHFSPLGSGPRNITGKNYGMRNFQMWKIPAAQPYTSIDLRPIVQYMSNDAGTVKGAGLMTITGSVHAPINFTQEGENRTQMVVSHNFAPGAYGGLREAYALYDFYPGELLGWFKFLTVGRFVAPYGLMTDEHRTYTRLQTNTGQGQAGSFHTGVALSGDPFFNMHYDLAFTNGFNQGGQSRPTDDSSPTAEFANLRLKFPQFPSYVGFSYANTEKKAIPSSWAACAYGVIAAPTLRTALLFESSHARGFNDATNINSGWLQTYFFAGQTAWYGEVQRSQSMANTAQINFELLPTFTLLYKYEEYIPDVDFHGYYFQRHGVGFRYDMDAGTYLNVRYETMSAGKEGVESAGQVLAVGNALYAFMHIWF